MPAVAWTVLTVFAFVLCTGGTACGVPVSMTLQNLTSANGVFLMPMWVGFHDSA